MGKEYIEQAYQEIYKHKDWKKEAKDYEEYLAVQLYNSSYTKEAVKTALTKISTVLTQYYGDGGKRLPSKEQLENAAAINDLAEKTAGTDQRIEVNKTLVEALMQEKKDNTGAGQIRKVLAGDERADGTQFSQDQADMRNMQKLDEVINGDGNLREQMGLLYNGMFINGGKTKEEIRNGISLKGVMQGAKDVHDPDQRDALGLDFGLLGGLEHFQKGKDVFDTYSLARDLEKREEEREGKGNRLTRWWRGIKRAWDSAILNNFRRSNKKKDRQQGLGMEHYERLGISLSERERDFALTLDKDGSEQIAWKEGTAYYTPDKETTAEGMLQVSGTSGTTLRMLGAYRLMGASQKELLDFRLALIAWMVTSHDHSLYEILRASHNAGVKGTEDLREAVTMYTNIDPLDMGLLREHFTKKQEFPHEIVYKEMLNEVTQARLEKEKGSLSPEEFEDRTNKRIVNQALMEQAAMLASASDAKTALWVEVDTTLRETENELADLVENNIEGPQRQECEEYLAYVQQYKATLENIIREIDEEYNAVEEQLQMMQRTGSGIYYPTLHQYEGNRNTSLTGVDTKYLSAQTLAVNIYTSGAYQSMNTAQKWGSIAGRMQMKKVNGADGTEEGYHLADKREFKSGRLNDQIYNMIQISARMVQDTLEEFTDSANENAPMIRTFRGEKGNGSKYQGKFVTNALTSTSKDGKKALGFYTDQARKHGYENAVLVLYELPQDAAVDISTASAYVSEQEVLMPRDTELVVTGELKKNVPFEEIEQNPNADYSKYREDTEVEKETLMEELGSGEAMEHVNIIQLTAVDGPSKRRKEARRAGNEARRQIWASFAGGQ